MRIVLAALAVAIILALGDFSQASVRDVVDPLVEPSPDPGAALRDAWARRAREFAERVEGASDRIEQVAPREAREVADALKDAASDRVEQVQDTVGAVRDSLGEIVSQKAASVADLVRQATADKLQQASDTLHELASGLRSR